MPKSPKTVISILFPYYLGQENYKNLNVSRYAVSWDYHELVIKRLNNFCKALKEKYPKNDFVAFVDNSPIPEVFAAAVSGLGVVGRNGLLINETYGSWVFIGEIVTDLNIDCKPIEIRKCIECNKCVESCPGNALDLALINREKCISFLSQKKGELSQEQKDLLKKIGSVWGCDICQEVCPMNAQIKITPLLEFFEAARPNLKKGDSIKGRAYEWRGIKTISRNIDLLD